MLLLGTNGHDELSAARAAEIDRVIEDLAQFSQAREMPVRIGMMFEHVFLSYAMLRSRDGTKCTVLLGQAAYDKAKSTGLLAWCAEQYPNVTFEPPTHVVRGCHASQVIVDEMAQWEPDEIRSHGG